MCGYCGKGLTSDLIETLRNELAGDVVISGDTGNSGNAALVNPGAVEASGGWQLRVENTSFQAAEMASRANVLPGEDTFVFGAQARGSENSTSTNWIEYGTSNRTENDTTLMSWQTTDSLDSEFWTYNLVSAVEDWYS